MTELYNNHHMYTKESRAYSSLEKDFMAQERQETASCCYKSKDESQEKAQTTNTSGRSKQPRCSEETDALWIGGDCGELGDQMRCSQRSWRVQHTYDLGERQEAQGRSRAEFHDSSFLTKLKKRRMKKSLTSLRTTTEFILFWSDDSYSD